MFITFLKHLFYKLTLRQENDSDLGRFILWSGIKERFSLNSSERWNRNRFWLMSIVESQSESY